MYMYLKQKKAWCGLTGLMWIEEEIRGLGTKHWELSMVEGSYICFCFLISLLEIKAFEDAAKQYQPLLPFFAVFDKKVNLP